MIYLEIFIIAFLLNFVWEVWHSRLYRTIHHMKFKNIVRLLTKMSIIDGIWIVLFYSITVLLFENINIFDNYLQLTVFIILALLFSYIDEKVSINMGRWRYMKDMPCIDGVGITPLLELAVTGTIAFALVFLFI